MLVLEMCALSWNNPLFALLNMEGFRKPEESSKISPTNKQTPFLLRCCRDFSLDQVCGTLFTFRDSGLTERNERIACPGCVPGFRQVYRFDTYASDRRFTGEVIDFILAYRQKAVKTKSGFFNVFLNMVTCF